MNHALFASSLLTLALCAGCGDDTGGAGGGGTGGGSGGGDTSGSTGTGSTSTGSTSDASSTSSGGLLPFGSVCTGDAECESGLCYAFGMGSKCTVACPADPNDCPGTTKECNNMEPAACKTP